jgi:chemotaxis protein CheC
MMQFSDFEKDALCEIFNISVSQAAAAMSEIVQQKITMTVPKVEICDISKAIHFLDQGYDICGISQQFRSNFSGKAILIFPEHRSLELVRLMVGVDTPLTQVTQLEQDALAEIGNIVLNACLASLSTMFNQRFDLDIPQLVFGDSSSVLSEYDEDNVLILLQIKFYLEERELEGSIVFVVNLQSLLELQKSVQFFVKDIHSG